MSIIDSAKIKQSDRDTIIRVLSKGNCIGLPTETVYGLAADATNGMGVAQIFEMKDRPKFNPLICHVSGIEMARTYGFFSDHALKLAETFWPGPLTIVLPLVEDCGLHPLVTAELGSVGLRQPKGIASDIIAHYGNPLAAPSANRSGKISSTTAQHVATEFPELLIVDNGACEVGLESSIVKIENEAVRLLRPGAITAEMIEEAIGIRPEINNSDRIEAPGMMKSHYAPDAGVEMNVTDFAADSAVLAFGDIGTVENKHVFNLSKNADLREAAANLYKGMKTLDQTGVKLIQVSPIPMEGLGLAINDRLQRAAAPRD